MRRTPLSRDTLADMIREKRFKARLLAQHPDTKAIRAAGYKGPESAVATSIPAGRVSQQKIYGSDMVGGMAQMRSPESRREVFRLIKRLPAKKSYAATNDSPYARFASAGRTIRFAKKDDDTIFTKRNALIAGGVGAAGLGVSLLPGARPMLRIAARKWLGTKGGMAESANKGGHFVADYMEGANKGLRGGAHGLLVGRFLDKAERKPRSLAAKIISHKIFNPQQLPASFAAAHMAKFSRGGKEALGHWDWEAGEALVNTAKKAPKGRLNKPWRSRTVENGRITWGQPVKIEQQSQDRDIQNQPRSRAGAGALRPRESPWSHRPPDENCRT
jgi:hypothetical protein